jgi:hypothetical protein
MDIYNEYAMLAFQIEELETKQASLKVLIIKDMIDKGEKKVDTSVGSIALQAGKKKWAYPEYVKTAEEEFKSAKAKSESTGEATYTEGEPFIKFNKIKL